MKRFFALLTLVLISGWAAYAGDPIGSVAFSPDGKQIYSCEANRYLRVCDTEKAKSLREFAELDHMDSVVISPDGKYLVAGGKVWNSLTGKPLQVSTLGEVSFSLNSKQMVSANRKKLDLYDVGLDENSPFSLSKSLDISKIEDLDLWIVKVLFVPNGKQILAALHSTVDGTGSVGLWSLDSGKLLRIFKSGPGSVNFAGFDCDGKFLTYCERERTTESLWSLDTDKPAFQRQSNATVLTYSSDGRQLAYCKPNGKGSHEILLFDVKDGKYKVLSPTGPITAAAFSPDGKQLACGTYFGSVELWDTLSLEKIRVFRSS